MRIVQMIDMGCKDRLGRICQSSARCANGRTNVVLPGRGTPTFPTPRRHPAVDTNPKSEAWECSIGRGGFSTSRSSDRNADLGLMD